MPYSSADGGVTALAEPRRAGTARAMRTFRGVRRWAHRHEYAAATAFLLVLLGLYFWPLLLGGQLGQDHVLYDGAPWKAERPAGTSVASRASEGDVAYEYAPLLDVARTQLHGGQLPVWNPYSSGGMPLLGDMQEALYYPLT